jgi:hypothetical protein
MTRQKCIQAIVRCACGDGNLLLGIGPMPDGRIEPRQAERLTEVGKWLEKYGDSIFKTRGGPFPAAPWGGTTYRGDTIYVHVMNWPNDGILLPTLDRRLVGSRLLSGGTAQADQGPQGIRIFAAPADRDEADTVIELKFGDRVPPPPAADQPGEQWTKEKAWNWYARLTPVVGCNFLPRTAVNTVEMWQEETFDPETIDEELGWARNAGYNSARVFLQYAVWKDDPNGFKQRLERFLSIASKHEILGLIINVLTTFILVSESANRVA